MTTSPSILGRFGRASGVATAAFLGLTIAGGSALAYWSTAGLGTGTGTTGTISTPTMTLTKTSDPSKVTVGFTAAATGVTPTSYVATATGGPAAVTCTASVSPWTCDLTGLTSGTTYSVTGVAKRLSSWTSTATVPQTLTPAASLSVSTSTLAAGTTGTAYNQTLAAAGGVTPYTWSVSGGSLPAGLTMSSSGVISGTPTVTGTSIFTVQVKDAAGAGQQTATRPLSITVNSPAAAAAPFAVTAPTSATAGTPFTVTIQAKNTAGSNDVTYTGNHAITITGPSTSPSGTAPTLPTTATFDASGLATVSVTVTKAETVALVVKDGTAARDASSGSVVVAAAAPSSMAFVNCSKPANNTTCSGQPISVTNNSSITMNVGLFDAFLNPAKPSSAVSVALTSGNTANYTVNSPATIGTTATQSGTVTISTGSAQNATDTAITGKASGFADITIHVQK